MHFVCFPAVCKKFPYQSIQIFIGLSVLRAPPGHDLSLRKVALSTRWRDGLGPGRANWPPYLQLLPILDILNWAVISGHVMGRRNRREIHFNAQGVSNCSAVPNWTFCKHCRNIRHCVFGQNCRGASVEEYFNIPPQTTLLSCSLHALISVTSILIDIELPWAKVNLNTIQRFHFLTKT